MNDLEIFVLEIYWKYIFFLFFGIVFTVWEIILNWSLFVIFPPGFEYSGSAIMNSHYYKRQLWGYSLDYYYIYILGYRPQRYNGEKNWSKIQGQPQIKKIIKQKFLIKNNINNQNIEISSKKKMWVEGWMCIRVCIQKGTGTPLLTQGIC